MSTFRELDAAELTQVEGGCFWLIPLGVALLVAAIVAQATS
jgi:lactobin A/cerein 7B family class IIb bacteriocin